MGLFSMSVDLADRNTVVLSTGGEGQAAVGALAEAGAHVRWIDPEIPQNFAPSSSLEICRRSYQPGDLKGCFVAVCGRLPGTAVAEVRAHAALRPGSADGQEVADVPIRLLAEEAPS